MAEATSQLQRIADLVTRTSAITRKQRGMRIEADEWNTLVDVLLGVLQVDRLQETSLGTQLEQRFALSDHEHLGQVSITWLDADLQSRIQGAGAVSTREVLAAMDQKLQAMRDELTSLRGTVDTHQQQLDRSAVNELDRSKALRDLQGRVDGTANLKTLVGTLSADVGGLRNSFDQVLDLKKSLTDPAGNAIDVAKMRQDVAGLLSLRDNLKGVDGNLLTMREIEVRLTDVANAVGVGTNSLAKQLADLQGAIETKVSDDTNKLIADAVAGVKADSQALETRVNASIQDSATQVTAAAKAETTSQVAASEVRQSAAFDAKLQDAVTTVRNGALADAGTLLDQRFATVPDIARDAANAAATQMGKTITADLQGRFTADTTTRLAAVEDRFNERVTPLETGLQSLKDGIAGIVQTAVQSATAVLQVTLNNQIAAAMASVQQQLQILIGTQVAAAVETSLSTLDQRIGNAVQAQMPAISKIVSQSVADATKNLNEEIAAEVKRQIGDLKLGLTIQTAIDASAQQLSANFASQLAAQDARFTTLVSTTAGTLRGEIKSAVDSSAAQSKQEILSAVDTKISRITTGGGVIIR